jgi:hypothetical protein
MVDTEYCVIRQTGRDAKGFYVEVKKPGEPTRITDNFSTMDAAYSWIDQARERAQKRAEPPRRWWHFSVRRRKRE